MKYTRLLSALALTSLSAYAFADVPTNDTIATPQQQAQITSLSKQITQLQAQAQQSSTSGNISDYVMLDTAAPFGLMADTTFPLQVLQAKQENNFTKPVVLGGYLEFDAQSWNGTLNIPSDNYQKGTNIYLTTAKLYAMGNLNNWTSAFLSLQGATNPESTTTFDQAFITFGNLNKNPLYLMIGESYLPFGVFAGNAPWSNSITTNDFRISQTNQVNLGFYQNGLTLNFAVANAGKGGNGNTSGQNLDDFVYNVNYAKTYTNSFNFSAGASYLSDIRGLNSNIGNAYNTVFSGGKNGAYDLNGSIGYKQFTLIGEYASTTTSAVNQNNTSTGDLSTWMTTLNYAPVLWGKLTTFSIGYSQSKNMQNVPYTVSGMFNSLPATGLGQGFKQQWIAFVQRPIFNNVYLGPEYDYAKTYSGDYTWTATVDLSAYF